MSLESSTLIDKIESDFKNAYKNKDFDRKNFLGLVKGEATKESKNPSDSQVLKTLKSFEKSLLSVIDANSTLDVQPGWGPKDELDLIQSYLPKQMSESEIETKLEEVISSGASNIGQIMSSFRGLEVDMKLVKKKADEILKLK